MIKGQKWRISFIFKVSQIYAYIFCVIYQYYPFKFYKILLQFNFLLSFCNTRNNNFLFSFVKLVKRRIKSRNKKSSFPLLTHLMIWSKTLLHDPITMCFFAARFFKCTIQTQRASHSSGGQNSLCFCELRLCQVCSLKPFHSMWLSLWLRTDAHTALLLSVMS